MRKLCLFMIIVTAMQLLTGCSIKVTGFGQQEVQSEEEVVTTETVTIGNEFVFDNTNVINSYELGAPSADISEIRLFVGDGKYFPVAIPAGLEYVTDYSKYIYAKDNSFSVSLISNITGELSDAAGIPVVENIDEYTLKTPDKYSGVATTCKYLPDVDKAVVIRGYNTAEPGYATACESLVSNSVIEAKYTEVEVADYWTQEITALPIVDPALVTIPVGIDFNELKMYSYNDGYLNMSKELRSFEEAIEYMNTKLCIATNENIAERYFKGNTIYYVEMNGFTVGVLKINFNTTVCLFGYGKEANANIVYYIKDFK